MKYIRHLQIASKGFPKDEHEVKVNRYNKGDKPCHEQLGLKQGGCKEIGEYHGYDGTGQQHGPFDARYPILGLVCPFPPVFPYGYGFLQDDGEYALLILCGRFQAFDRAH